MVTSESLLRQAWNAGESTDRDTLILKGPGGDPVMNNRQLAAHVAAKTSLSKSHAAAVSAVFSAIADALAGGETVTIAGFGAFSTRSRPVRPGRNPRTGETITIAASTAPSFKAGKTLRDAVK